MTVRIQRLHVARRIDYAMAQGNRGQIHLQSGQMNLTPLSDSHRLAVFDALRPAQLDDVQTTDLASSSYTQLRLEISAC